MSRNETRGPDSCRGAGYEIHSVECLDLAHELHDTVVQPLSALLMSMEVFQQQAPNSDTIGESVDTWLNLAQEALVCMRSTLAGLQAHPHAELGLPDALQQHVMPEFRGSNLRLVLETRDWPTDLPVAVTTSLYLTVREALTNIAKHSRATTATVQLVGDADTLSITVTDNGVGFQPETIAAERSASAGYGLGLSGMAERAQKLGGRLSIVAAPGQGTRLEVRIRRPRSARRETRQSARLDHLLASSRDDAPASVSAR